MDPVKRVLRVDADPFGHLRYALGPERVLGVDVEHLAIEASLVERQDRVDGELERNLGLSAAELTVHLDDGLSLESPPQQLVQGGGAGSQFLHPSATIQQGFAADETADVGYLLGARDDLGGDGLAQLGLLSQLHRAHHRYREQLLESGLTQFLRGRGTHSWEILYRVLRLIHVNHYLLFLYTLTCSLLGHFSHLYGRYRASIVFEQTMDPLGRLKVLHTAYFLGVRHFSLSVQIRSW